MSRGDRRSVPRLAIVLAMVSALVWGLPAQAGPTAPTPTVTITTEPMLGRTLPPTLKASWTVDRPGVMATLRVEGEVLARTTVVAVWTSPQHLIKRNQGYGGMINSWSVTQAPLGKQSLQQVSSRMTTLRGKWEPWGHLNLDRIPYATASRIGTAISLDFWYEGPTLPRGQVQYRLVLTLEPGTHVDHQSWNVAG